VALTKSGKTFIAIYSQFIFQIRMKFWLFAIAVEALQNNCVPQKSIGEFCDFEDECESGFCFENQCSLLPKIGDRCSEPDYKCSAGLGCSISGVCEPLAQEGDHCQRKSNRQYLCANDLLCYSGYCQKPRALCSDDRQCRENEVCKLSNGACFPAPKVGKPCQNKCRKGHYCDFSKRICKKQKGFGRNCKNNSAECKQNLECLKNTNFLTRGFSPFTCQKIPSKALPCLGKCKNGFYCMKTKQVQLINFTSFLHN
jgi:hypothetical protein